MFFRTLDVCAPPHGIEFVSTNNDVKRLEDVEVPEEVKDVWAKSFDIKIEQEGGLLEARGVVVNWRIDKEGRCHVCLQDMRNRSNTYWVSLDSLKLWNNLT
jgi:hypothetical protein